MRIGPAHLRAMRVAMKMTQKELGEEIGVAENTIWRYEHGHLRLTERTLKAVRAVAKLRGVWNL